MWLSRLEKMIDSNKLEKIKNTSVLIIGIGGVGGNALEAIVRMGVNNIIIVDNDIIDITNLNRQLISLRSSIGEYKVDAAIKRVKDINNECNIIGINKFIDKSNINFLFNYKIDYVIDCCDTISTKIVLIEECLKRNIKFISCMGTGNKFHPEMLEIDELKKTSYDDIFSKEFLGRIDCVLPYNSITEEIAMQYAQKNLLDPNVNLEQLILDAEVEKFGLRNLKNQINKLNKKASLLNN